MKNVVSIILLLLASTLLVSCTSPMRLVETHDIEFHPMDKVGPLDNTVLLKTEKSLLLAALSKAWVRSYDLCDCHPSCWFAIRGTKHILSLHDSSTLKLDTTKEYHCDPEEIRTLLKLIEDRSNKLVLPPPERVGRP